MNRLSGLHALIIGAGSGIGQAIAIRFAQEGAHVLALDLSLEALDDTLGAIREASGSCEALIADVSDTESMRTVFASLKQLDILVNNAGIAHVGNVLNTTPADMDRLYAVNVRGVYHGLHFGLPLLVESGKGAVLNLCSVAAHLGLPDRFAYSMTKGAVLSMTMSVARDYLAQGVRSNCLCPARVHTPFVDGFIAKNYPGREAEMFKKLAEWQPIGRMAQPLEIASFAAYLCSPEASFITGSAYDIDGGVTHLR